MKSKFDYTHVQTTVDILNMEAADSSETFTFVYLAIWRHFPQDRNPSDRLLEVRRSINYSSPALNSLRAECLWGSFC